MAEESSGSRFNLPFEPNANGVREYWGTLSRPVQIGIIAFIVAFIAFIILMVVYTTRPRMEALFTGMDPVQAREVTERLEEMGVNYQLADDGTTILVHEDYQDRLRLQLSPDLYARGMGFTVFEQDGLMVSDHDRRKQWQVVLQDELARTVSSIATVQWARVHLVLPEEGVFLRDRAEPSASIFVNMEPNADLSEQQVNGILSLVSGSVESLNPENITIVNDRGEAYHDPYYIPEDGSNVSADVQERMIAQRDFEQELEDRLRTYLEIVFGEENVVAMISAELDFDIFESTSISYDPDNVERAIHRIQEREVGGESTLPEEVAEPNIPGYEAPIIMAEGEYTREYLEEIINYEIGELHEYMARSPGRVDRLSATVILNVEDDDGIGEDVSTLVAAAIGHDPARGDMIAVQAIPFDTGEIEPDWQRAEVEQLQRMILYGVIAAVILMMILIGLFYLRSQARYRQMVAAEGDEDIDISDDESLDGFDIGEFIGQEEPEEIEEDIRDRVRRAAEQEPESVAFLLRSWLTE